MRWPWKRKEKYVPNVEALHAQARAIEDVHRTQDKWTEINQTLKLVRANGFGADLKIALGRKRG